MTWRATVTDADELTVWSKEGDGPLPLLEAMVGFFREDGRADLVGWLVSPTGFEKAYMPWESDAVMRIVSQGTRSARWTAVVRHRGNSLAVTVPAEIARELGLKDGDEVDVEVSRRRGCRGGPLPGCSRERGLRNELQSNLTPPDIPFSPHYIKLAGCVSHFLYVW